MQIQLINVAQKLPAWVDQGCNDYLKRLPREVSLQLVTIPLPARKSQQSPARQQQRESELILPKLTAGSLNIALDERGEQWSSIDWSNKLQLWMFEFPRVNLVIGGPDEWYQCMVCFVWWGNEYGKCHTRFENQSNTGEGLPPASHITAIFRCRH